MPGLTQIAPAQLARLIGTPECPDLIDICLPEDFALYRWARDGQDEAHSHEGQS